MTQIRSWRILRRADSRRRCCATQLRPFLYAVLVVPGALLLHVIVVTMFSTPLASSESLCVVFIVIIGTSPRPVSKTLVVRVSGPPSARASDAQAQSENGTQREADAFTERARRPESPARVS